MLDEDKDYQEMLDQQDADWWHQLDLEVQQQIDEQKQAILDDLNSKVCPRGKK